MALNRTALIRGPANITWNGHTYYSQGDIVCRITKEIFDVMTSAHGVVATRLAERTVEVSFTPAGEWETTAFEALFPGASTIPGASWFGSSDLPFVIQPINSSQNKITLTNANIVRPPQLILSATKTLMGPVTFRALNKNNAAWSDAAALLAAASGTPADVTLNPSAIKTQPYTAAWGALSGFTALHTIDGWTLDFDLQLAPFNVDAYGTLDMTFQRMDVSARAKPVGTALTEALSLTAMKIQDTGVLRGGDAGPSGGVGDMVWSSLAAADTGTTFFTAYNMHLISAGLNYGMNSNRFDEYVWKTNRVFSSGAVGPVFAFATPSASEGTTP